MKNYNINNKIRSINVRIIEGVDKLGLYSKWDAQKLADTCNLDLVEISNAGDISICKIVDYGKFRFQLEKSEKFTPLVKIKEVQFGVGIAENDYNTKLGRLKDFLTEGNKTKIQIKFKGRQMGHPEVGHNLSKKIVADLSEYGKLEHEPKMAGKAINFQLTPIKK